MEIFARDGESLLTTFTSRVRRILLTASGQVAFVETANSVYRIAFDSPWVADAKAPPESVSVRFSPDGFEVTVVEGAAAPNGAARSPGDR